MSVKLKLISLFLVLLLAIPLLFSCDTGNRNGGDTSETGEVTSEPGGETTDAPPISDTDTLKFEIIDGNLNFRIVRPCELDADNSTVLAAVSLRNTLAELFGIDSENVAITDDFLIRGQSRDPDMPEILVGLTGYDETAQVIEDCGYGDYAIRAVGNKIVVLAYSDSSIIDSVRRLSKIIGDSFDSETGVSVVSKSVKLDILKTYNEKLSALPVYEGGEFCTFYDAGDRLEGQNCSEIIINETTAEEYREYLSALSDADYTEYTTHEMNGNLFATYTNSSYTVNVGFYKYENAVRLLIEPLAPAVGLKSENDGYTVRTTSQITMLGLEYLKSDSSWASNGLSVVIRLADGRFIVIDGGFNHTGCLSSLINTIKEQSPYTTEPVIAAWIITHAHGDHNNLINAQANAFINAGIKIERFITNFMSDTERQKTINYYMEKGSGNWSAGEGGNYTKTLDAAKKLKADVYKVHVGQVFWFADCKLEVLYTLESYAPAICNAFNTTSLILKMTIGDTVYMSTGDATGNAMQLAAQMYGSYLKSDIVQVSHHGYSTWGNDSGTILGYKTINAKLALWPQGFSDHESTAKRAYNKAIFNTSDYKEYYVAGAVLDRITVPLPYVVGRVTVERAAE